MIEETENMVQVSISELLERDIRFIVNKSINSEDNKEALFLICFQKLKKKYTILNKENRENKENKKNNNFSTILKVKLDKILSE